MHDSHLKHKELLDVIDENGVIVDARPRDEVHHLGLRHREVHVWFFDKDKNIYFSKSASNKNSAGLLDAPVGGHVDHEESPIFTAVREVKEESGLVVKDLDLIFLNEFSGISTYTHNTQMNNFLRLTYIYTHPVNENDLKFDPRESDGFLKFPISFLQKMSDEEKAKFHRFVPTHELPFVFDYVNNV